MVVGRPGAGPGDGVLLLEGLVLQPGGGVFREPGVAERVPGGRQEPVQAARPGRGVDRGSGTAGLAGDHAALERPGRGGIGALAGRAVAAPGRGRAGTAADRGAGPVPAVAVAVAAEVGVPVGNPPDPAAGAGVEDGPVPAAEPEPAGLA